MENKKYIEIEKQIENIKKEIDELKTTKFLNEMKNFMDFDLDKKCDERIKKLKESKESLEKEKEKEEEKKERAKSDGYML